MKNVFPAEKKKKKKKNGLQNIIIAKVSLNKSNIPSPLDTAGLLLYLWANKKRISFKVYCTPHAAWDRRGVHPPPKILCFKYGMKCKVTSKISPKKWQSLEM